MADAEKYRGKDHQLWVAGGVYDGGPSTTTAFYSQEARAWISGPPLKNAVYRLEGETVGGDVYAVGGASMGFTYQPYNQHLVGCPVSTLYTIQAGYGAHGYISPRGLVVGNQGDNQEFTMSPETGYHVSEVVVDGSSVGSPTSYTFYNVSADHTIHVTFAIDTHTITASADVNGSISPSGSVTVDHGETQTFSLTPNIGYHIAGVSSSCGGSVSGNTYITSPITADCVVTANFAINTYTVTPSVPGGNGTLNPSRLQTVDYGLTTSFTVMPSPGYPIVNVVGCGGSLVGSSYTTGGIFENCTVTATFATYTINASAGSNGSISPSGAVTVEHGISMTFAMVPSAHYHVSDVLVDGSSVGAVSSYTFTGVTAGHTISVTFGIDTYTISASARSHGTITPSGSVVVSHGANRAFTITASGGYYVLDVEVDGASMGVLSTYTFTDVTSGGHWIHATFAPAEITVLPMEIDFGNVPSGSTSEGTVTVLNTGLVNLVLGTIGSPAGSFSRTGGDCTNGMTLHRGASCTIEVTFSPTGSGVFTSSFNITSNALDDPTVTVNLEGGSGPDFIGVWTTPVAQVCSSPTKCKLAGVLTVRNVGNQDALASIYVNFYLSADGVHYSEPPLKAASGGKLKVGKSKAVKLSVTVTSSALGKYVIGVIDATHLVAEANEENNNVASGPIP